MKIADIYIRVSSGVQRIGSGQQRQSESCEKWCRENNVQVRRTINDVCSAFHGHNLSKGNLKIALDEYRKAYWHQLGEPLTDEECDKDIKEVTPPNYLVVETFDRFSRQKPLEVVITLMWMSIFGTKLAIVNENLIIDGTAFMGKTIFKDQGRIRIEDHQGGRILF
jgi:DNA invertase Pin-like site-specific DNA recombinase